MTNAVRLSSHPTFRIRKGSLIVPSTYLFSLIYAATLAFLSLDVFKDRINYLRYAESSLAILQGYSNKGILVALVNEPVWLLINAGLAKYFDPQIVVRILIFFSAFLVACYICLYNKKYFLWVVVFLFLPQVVGNYIVHLRQGLAIAIFLAGWYSNKRMIKWFLLGVTPLIHATFFFVITIYFLAEILKKIRFAADLRTVVFLIFAIVISLSLGVISAKLGVWQAWEYHFTAADISGLSFLFWSGILAIMCLQGKIFLRTYVFEIGGLLFYLISYWLVPVTARIFESMLLLILVAGLHLTKWRRILFLFGITSYCILQYALRINQPWLGFEFQ